MLFQIQAYIKFLLKSSNQHKVHSPFVYNLITDCFYDKTHKNWYENSDLYKKSLLQNKTSIYVQDFGVGSKKLRNSERKISSIAKNAGISTKRARLLGRIIAYLEVDSILEIGTSLGIATASMSFANPNGNIITLEGCPNTALIAEKNFEHFAIQNIDMIVGNFRETIPQALKKTAFDLIYFDGNHQKEATIQYFEQCLTKRTNNSIFIFDDIYWSEGMQEAWNYIKDHSDVTVSIDTFYWGIVCFRQEQPKQHFTIRL